MKIAIIGSGISGLASAYLLNQKHDVDLFEATDHIGGHSNTVMVNHNNIPLPIDTGFIVYNEQTYPYLKKLFAELGVPTKPAPMSFSLSSLDGSWEYGTRSVWGIFAQPSKLLKPAYWRFLLEFGRFFKFARAAIDDTDFEQMTLGEFVSHHGLSEHFKRYYIVPMVSAIWSSPLGLASDFPAQYMMKFYENHGLLEAIPSVKWRTVVGGSCVYVQKILDTLKGDIYLSTPVTQIERHANHVTLHLEHGEVRQYDHVVIATHSDQALKLLGDASNDERDILGSIPYEPGTAVLHTDETAMPKRQAAWAAWNYLLDDNSENTSSKASLTYWMNELQTLGVDQTYLVTMNPVTEIDPDKIIQTIQYSHPVYTLDSLTARRRLPTINGKRHTHFAGAYFTYGFHEDGIRSAVTVARDLGVDWASEDIIESMTSETPEVQTT